MLPEVLGTSTSAANSSYLLRDRLGIYKVSTSVGAFKLSYEHTNKNKNSKLEFILLPAHANVRHYIK